MDWQMVNDINEKPIRCDKNECKRNAVGVLDLFRVGKKQKFCNFCAMKAVLSCIKYGISFKITYYKAANIEMDLEGNDE